MSAESACIDLTAAAAAAEDAFGGGPHGNVSTAKGIKKLKQHKHTCLKKVAGGEALFSKHNSQSCRKYSAQSDGRSGARLWQLVASPAKRSLSLEHFNNTSVLSIQAVCTANFYARWVISSECGIFRTDFF